MTDTPRFLRALTDPTGVSADHWAFQERLARPHVELDAVVFTSGQPFSREDAEAWWLAYDTLNAVDRELRDVDLLLQSRNKEVLKARRVKGAGSPEMLARTIQTRNWRPIDARLKVSDVPRIVEDLGGAKLYGNNPTVALRELIQNSADAVQARRKFEGRAADWGLIKVGLRKEGIHTWLFVEDNGIGMSENVLTGPLLDFGTSFWRSAQAMEEFPGLMAAGMRAIGRFGIGFFSVFMLGPIVRVYSRRCDKGHEMGRLLEFLGGTSARPILSPVVGVPVPIDGGTRVEVLLEKNPEEDGGLLYRNSYPKGAIALSKLVCAVAPNLDVAIETIASDRQETVARPGDWLTINSSELVRRLSLSNVSEDTASQRSVHEHLDLIESDGHLFGRASISAQRSSFSFSFSDSEGWITVSGLRAARLQNVEGVLLGEAVTAARDSARPLATEAAMKNWASKQAELIAATVKDEERQARCAEVVLECGGDIGDLKFVRWGIEWLNTKEFNERLASADEIAISFDGEFDYDEDRDDVHPVDFRDRFKVSDDVAYIFKHSGEILTVGGRSWPRCLTGKPKVTSSNLEEYCRELIKRSWGNAYLEDENERVVGSVGEYSTISRDVTVFKKSA